jgi:palmitoyltransferase
LLTYIILIKKDPGYQKNKVLLNDCKRENINNPLKKLVDDGKNLKDYCPVCFVEKGYERNIKHCFICNKCVLSFNHHCFWINKCIGKENKIVYLIFIFFSFVYTFHLIFISIYLLFDSVNIPYEKPFPLDWFNFAIDRGFRVLGAGIVFVFAFIISFPLFFLFMIEIYKSCGILGKKTRLNNEDDNIKLIENYNVEPLINKSNNDNKNLINNININNDNIINTNENNNNDNNEQNNEIDEKRNEEEKKIIIPQDNFPLVDNRPSNE